MFLRDLVKSILRRWYVVVLGIALTVFLGLQAYQSAPVTYQAEASLVLIPPPDSVTIGDNPFLYLGGLDQALGVLTVKLNSSEAQTVILAGSQDNSYTVAKDSDTTGPIMRIDASSSSAQGALKTLGAVVDETPKFLDVLQNDLKVPKQSKLATLVLSVDKIPVENDKAKIRSLLVMVAAGGAGTLLLTGLFDRMIGALKDRKLRKGQATEVSFSEDAELEALEYGMTTRQEALDISNTTLNQLQSPRPTPDVASEAKRQTPDPEVRGLFETVETVGSVPAKMRGHSGHGE